MESPGKIKMGIESIREIGGVFLDIERTTNMDDDKIVCFRIEIRRAIPVSEMLKILAFVPDTVRIDSMIHDYDDSQILIEWNELVDNG